MTKHNAEIHVVVVDGYSPSVDVKGTGKDILIALGWLTLAICDRLGFSVDKLTKMMPLLVGVLRSSMSGATVIDLAELRRQREEDGPR